MATMLAIQAVTRAALRALKESPRPAAWPEPKFVALRGQDFATPPPELPADALGVSLYLWRVSLNAAMRNRRHPSAPDGTRRKPPVVVDLMYLLSGWGKTALDQQMVLGWALRALADVGTLPRGLLNDGAATPEEEVFAPGESAELSWEPIPSEFAAPVSDLLKGTWPPTVVVAVRGVVLDSALADAPEYGPVQIRALDARPADVGGAR
jgi:hypothetical protein